MAKHQPSRCTEDELCLGAGECTAEQVEDWYRRRLVEVEEWAKRFTAASDDVK